MSDTPLTDYDPGMIMTYPYGIEDTDTCILCGLILTETELNTCEHCIRKLRRIKAEAQAKREGQLKAEAGPKKDAKPPSGDG